MGNLQIDNPRLAAEWHPTKNGDLIPSSITVGSVKKVWWRCSKGHEWQASPNNRSKGQGCPYCAGRRVLAGFNDLATTNPELAAEWHPTKNGENTPTCVTKGSGKKVWWLCSRGHVWQATIANRSKGRGCPQCHKIEKGSIRERAAIEKNGSFASECPELLQDWDAEKNEVDPKEISKNSTRKVWWKCHHCGYSWRSAVEKRSRANHGCPACVGKAVQPGFNDLATVRPDVAEYWNSSMNGSLTPQSVTAGSNKMVWWICNEGHAYQTTVSAKSNGAGCPFCANQRVLNGFNDLATTNPELAMEWHPTKNGGLKPKDITAGSSRLKVWWQCPVGHSYQATAASRRNGAGCPECDKESKTSFPEQALLYYLGQLTTAESRHQYAGKTEVDIYLPEINAAVEYDGHYWHSRKAAKVSEMKKDRAMAEDGIRLVHVKEVKRGDAVPPSTANVIYCEYSSNGKFIEKMFNELAQLLGFAVEEISKADVDIARDRAKIYSQYIESIKASCLATIDPNLARQWNPEKNNELTPKMVSANSGKRVWWLCAKGHSWQATVDSRRRGNGCPYCSGQRVLPGFNDLATTNPELAIEWHPTKNGGLKPKDITAGSSRLKVWWLCPEGHAYQMTPANRATGRGCPTCGMSKRALSRHRSHIETHETLDVTNPELCIEWDCEKNGELTPSDVTSGSSKKVWWLCANGHHYEASVCNRVNHRGCPYCSGKKVLSGFNDLATVNPSIAAQWHPVKNLPNTPGATLSGSHKKAWWLCGEGHEWEASVKSRAVGNTGCPYCSNQKVLKGYNDLESRCPDIAAMWNGEKNGDLRPDQVTLGSGKQVWWKCSEGHEWEAQIYRMIQKPRCPICRRTSKVSTQSRPDA